MDPQWDLLPPPFRKLEPEAALLRFSLEMVESLAELVPAMKFQVAFYERFGSSGFRALEQAVRRARALQILVIIDCKRGDIGSTAQEYAHAYLDEEGPLACDAVTLNPYLGRDSLEPFLAFFPRGKGAFALVRTSNPSAPDLQDLDVSGHPLFETVGEKVKEWGSPFVGENGYSSLGAVVGATYPQEAERLRQVLPETFFLLPGYGAQGASEADIALAFDRKGEGVLVNSSRAILFAYRDPVYVDLPPQRYLEASQTAYKQATNRIRHAIDERMKNR
jgi:orotidine-5'-phosphate decarboxylase